MNSTLESRKERVADSRATTTSRNGLLAAERPTSLDLPNRNGSRCFETRTRGLNGKSTDRQTVVVQAPAIATDAKNGKSALPPHSRKRQLFFRCVRLALAGALVSAAVAYARRTFTTAMSERAFLNADIVTLRAPIGGELNIENIERGKIITAGTPLFSIQNPRFGNQEVLSQLNFVEEAAERFRAEYKEAAVKVHQQEEIYALNEKLHVEKLISRLELLEERSKLEVARTVMVGKEEIAIQAERRRAAIQKQVELQKAAVARMPFDGVAWAIPARNGAEMSPHETILELIDPRRVWVDAFFNERHAGKFAVGTDLNIRTLDGRIVFKGTVESVRGGVGRIPYDAERAVAPNEYAPRRIAVRVRPNGETPFDAGQFYGMGRNVVVTLGHE